MDDIFEAFRLDAHIPGLAYGLVSAGVLTQSGGLGLQDLDSRLPVTRQSVFRIASMTKAFTALTILALRDDGRLGLDDPAALFVPEMQDWPLPSRDSPVIRIRDLLHHTAGFVSDDPWGDRQNALPHEEFRRFLAAGVTLSRVPGTAFEYANIGFALLGLIISRLSGAAFAETVAARLLRPLGMSATTFDADSVPPERSARGYRWEDSAWRQEPVLQDGAFGAMGGLHSTVDDYARWVACLLSAWPPRDDPETAPLRRSTLREMAQGLNFPRPRRRPGRSSEAAPTLSMTYGMGFDVTRDPELGLVLCHDGGYPGYGSHVLLLPERGVGLFAFANRTYAAPSPPVWDAARQLMTAGLLPIARVPVASPALTQAYALVQAIYAAGDVTLALDQLAMNFLQDRDAAGWGRDLASLKAAVGALVDAAPLVADGALSGDFTWRCAHGRISGRLALAATQPPTLQKLTLAAITP